MHDGIVEQIGAPLDLYDNPANLFVAGFIGSPAMNFLRGTIRRNGTGMVVNLGDGRTSPRSTGLRARARRSRRRSPGASVRASHRRPAEVVVVEPTGADTQISCTIGGKDITAIVRERHEFKPGGTIRLQPELTYLFDRTTGARL